MIGLIILAPSKPKFDETDSSGMKGLVNVTAFECSSFLRLKESVVLFYIIVGSVLAIWPV